MSTKNRYIEALGKPLAGIVKMGTPSMATCCLWKRMCLESYITAEGLWEYMEGVGEVGPPLRKLVGSVVLAK